jgi:hypothetical protein
VTILSVLRHLNYRPWYALAEFVDNSLQSFLTHKDAISQADGCSQILRVQIEFDATEPGQIVIRDNAAGIYESEYASAFRPAEIPPDTSGLCEFGMGMKSAACWFARRWSVRTSALGEPVERTVAFDVDRIVQDRIEELEITSRPTPANTHYTEIILSDLHHSLHGRTLGKIKDHIPSIYRVFLREGVLSIKFGDDTLAYEEPEILVAPYYVDSAGSPVLWRKEINFDFGMGQRARGFAALRARASTSLAGFALFRRDRLIQGSGDETYRPESIFGKTNSYRYQRLFGELHLDGFEISHTKDGFRWEQYEDVFLELLKEHLTRDPLNLLDQAEGHRVRASQRDLTRSAERATDRTAAVIERDVPPVLEREINQGPDPSVPSPELPSTVLRASNREISIELNGQPWQIAVETAVDPAIGEWISISDRSDFEEPKTHRRIRRVAVRMSLAHPFMDRFCGSDPNSIEALLRVAAGLGLAYTAARDVGATLTNTIIRNLNELLRNGLSQP